MFDLSKTNPIAPAEPIGMPALPIAQPAPAERSTWALFFLIVGSILCVILLIVIAERVLPLHVKPSTMLSAAVGNASYVATLEELDAKKAEMAALQTELARAQGAIEDVKGRAAQEVESMRGRVQIALQAYTGLWQTSQQMISSVYQMRTELANAQQGGRTGAVTLLDLGSALAAAFGDTATAAHLNGIRNQTAQTSLNDMDAAIARSLPALDLDAFKLRFPDPDTLLKEPFVPALVSRSTPAILEGQEKRPVPAAPIYRPRQ